MCSCKLVSASARLLGCVGMLGEQGPARRVKLCGEECPCLLACLMKISRSRDWPKGLYFRLNLSNLEGMPAGERGGLGNAGVEEHIRAENGSDEGGTVRLTHVRSWHMRARTREGHSEARLRHRATGRRPGGCAARGAVLPTNLWKMFLSACTSRVSTFRS